MNSPTSTIATSLLRTTTCRSLRPSARAALHTTPSISLWTSRLRPALFSHTHVRLPTIRTIFIQTETTPNIDAIKFLPNARIIPEDLNRSSIEYLNPRSTIAPPYPSPLAAQLMNVEGVESVFYGADFITVTKATDANWAFIRPEIFALITETVTSGATVVHAVERKEGEEVPAEEVDSLAYDENDSEVVGMIKELLETRIRPAIQEDGGDIEFRGFNEKDGMVNLMLKGACRTCDSSTETLKNGIENMLMHYIEEVRGVQQVIDPEEAIAIREFEKFEEKLQQQRSASAEA